MPRVSAQVGSVELISSGPWLILIVSRLTRYSMIKSKARVMRLARCSVPAFDGTILSVEWKEALWAKFFTGAPQRLRQSVERYRIVKRA